MRNGCVSWKSSRSREEPPTTSRTRHKKTAPGGVRGVNFHQALRRSNARDVGGHHLRALDSFPASGIPLRVSHPAQRLGVMQGTCHDTFAIFRCVTQKDRPSECNPALSLCKGGQRPNRNVLGAFCRFPSPPLKPPTPTLLLPPLRLPAPQCIFASPPRLPHSNPWKPTHNA